MFRWFNFSLTSSSLKLKVSSVLNTLFSCSCMGEHRTKLCVGHVIASGCLEWSYIIRFISNYSSLIDVRLSFLGGFSYNVDFCFAFSLLHRTFYSGEEFNTSLFSIVNFLCISRWSAWRQLLIHDWLFGYEFLGMRLLQDFKDSVLEKL